jgi:hypothetical protein
VSTSICENPQETAIGDLCGGYPPRGAVSCAKPRRSYSQVFLPPFTSRAFSQKKDDSHQLSMNGTLRTPPVLSPAQNQVHNHCGSTLAQNEAEEKTNNEEL